jgi:hypothetical protein
MPSMEGGALKTAIGAPAIMEMAGLFEARIRTKCWIGMMRKRVVLLMSTQVKRMKRTPAPLSADMEGEV